MKVLFFDIENIHRPEHIFNSGKPGRFAPRPAGFCADLAYILVFGYKFLGDAHARSITATKKDFKSDPLTDNSILADIYAVMSEADVIVSWYGEGHDYPFIISRLAQAGYYLDTEIRHVDLFKVASKKLRLSSNRLNNVSKFFGQEPKMDIDKKTWADCWSGNYEALQHMADYCRQDVEVLEQVYNKLLPLGTKMPHFGKSKGYDDTSSCAHCGSTRLIGHGYRVTKLMKYHRLHCNDCGGKMKGKKVS